MDFLNLKYKNEEYKRIIILPLFAQHTAPNPPESVSLMSNIDFLSTKFLFVVVVIGCKNWFCCEKVWRMDFIQTKLFPSVSRLHPIDQASVLIEKAVNGWV